MRRPGTKVTERNCQPLSTVGRTGTRSSFCFLLFALLFAPSASIVPNRRHGMAEQATVQAEPLPSAAPRWQQDCSQPRKACASLRLPHGPRRVLFRFPNRLSNPFQNGILLLHTVDVSIH